MKSEQNRKQKLLRSSRRVGDWYFMLTKYGIFPPLSTVAILHELRSSAQLSVKSLGSSCTFQMSDVNQESEVIYRFSFSINSLRIIQLVSFVFVFPSLFSIYESTFDQGFCVTFRSLLE